MKRRYWTEDELQVMRDQYPNRRTDDIAKALGRKVTSVYAKAENMGLNKSEAFKRSPEAGRFDGNKGIGTRFTQGHKTWNAGMKGLQMGGQATQFKPGNRSGRAIEIYQPIGAERVRDGYLCRKMRDTGPMHLRWELVHRLNWEAAHGPIPDGHVVVFKNGNTMETGVENLELISRKQLVERNTIHRYPPALKALIRLNAKVRRNIDEHQQ